MITHLLKDGGFYLFKLVFIMLALGVGASQAGVKLSIYEDSQIVADKSTKARQNAMHEAFVRVLVRVSGNRQIMTIPDIEKFAKQPEQFLQAYEYQAHNSEDAQHPNWQARFVFDKGKVNDLLQKQGQAVWDDNRPHVLVWWVLGLDPLAQSSEILGHDTSSAYLQVWQKQAAKRGLQTTFPMADLATLATVDVQDIWQLHRDNLARASERYQADVMVALTMSPTADGVWRGSVNLFNTNGVEVWQLQHAQPELLVQAMVDHLADHFAQQQARQQSNQPRQQIKVMISRIYDAKGFQQIQEYIASLAKVHEVSALWMKGDKVLLGVQYQGDPITLAKELHFDNRLQPENNHSEEDIHSDIQLKFIS